MLALIQLEPTGLGEWDDQAAAETEDEKNAHNAEVEQHCPFSVEVLRRLDLREAVLPFALVD